MIKIILPSNIAATLSTELALAGRKEIGGVLMGEHIAENEFAVREITIQRIGAFATFQRVAEYVVLPLRNFFKKTNNRFTRFNYLGEWHSHHSFELHPSSVDEDTMYDLVNDVNFGANFITLLIIKLSNGGLEGSVHIYFPGKSSIQGELKIERP